MKKGIESLKAAVLEDCTRGQGCFNPDGCNHEFTRMVPEENPRLRELGYTESCRHVSKCQHRYCDKYKWILDRAKMYADLTKKTVEEVLEAWEEQRSYWYMNFYQDCNQPEIKLSEGIKVLLAGDWVKELKEKFGEDPRGWKFVCPSCGNVQSGEDFIKHGIEDFNGKVYMNCIGRYVEGIGCDWTLGGLFQIHKTVVVSDMKIYPVFEMA